jgi:hypothetical protein
MTQPQHTPLAQLLEEAIITLFCEIDDRYRILNPQADLYASLKGLSDSEVITLAIFQQSCGAWSPSAPSCARSPAFSATSSPRSSASIPPRSTGGYANSGDISNL